MTNENRILVILETMAEDVKELKQDVSSLNQRMGRMEHDVGELKEDVGKLKEDVGKLKEDVGKLKEDVGKLKEDVGRVKESVIRIENEQGKEIRTLFDGYNMNRDLYTASESRITVLENRCEAHDVKFLALPCLDILTERKKPDRTKKRTG